MAVALKGGVGSGVIQVQRGGGSFVRHYRDRDRRKLFPAIALGRYPPLSGRSLLRGCSVVLMKVRSGVIVVLDFNRNRLR